MSQSIKLAIAILFSIGAVGCAVSDVEDQDEVEDVAVSTSVQEVDTGAETSLGSTWCCRARTVFSDNWECFQFKTIGAWAAAKCGAFFGGVPLVDGIRLSKQSCSSVPECL